MSLLNLTPLSSMDLLLPVAQLLALRGIFAGLSTSRPLRLPTYLLSIALRIVGTFTPPHPARRISGKSSCFESTTVYCTCPSFTLLACKLAPRTLFFSADGAAGPGFFLWSASCNWTAPSPGQCLPCFNREEQQQRRRRRH